MRRGRAIAIVLAATGCGDDVSTGNGMGTTESTGSGGAAETTETTSSEGGMPCVSEDSRFTVLLASPELASFVIHIGNGTPTTSASCPDGTIDGTFADRVECAVGNVTLLRAGEYMPVDLVIALDDGAPESFDAACENTSMCPKMGRTVCEVDMSDAGSSSDTTI